MKAMKMLKMVMLGSLVFGINTGIANAALITGGMGITGNYDADATTLTLNTATGTSGYDDLGATVTFGTSGAINNGVIFYTAAPFAAVPNVLQIGDWQLELSTLVIDPNSTTDKLKLGGTAWLTGVANNNGFDRTAATWTFSANTASSYSMSITAVPVPAAVWLFGTGLIGLVGVARRKA